MYRLDTRKHFPYEKYQAIQCLFVGKHYTPHFCSTLKRKMGRMVLNHCKQLAAN